MSRFEEQFKNTFEHFEPEVDPKLWQNISQQLPSTPQVHPGASSAGKSIIAKLGVKGIAAILAASAITVLSIVYLTNKNDGAHLPNVENANETESSTFNIPSNDEGEALESTIPVTGHKSEADKKAKEPVIGPDPTQESNKNKSENLPETASTGDLIEDKGEPSPVNGSPSSQKEVIQSGNSTKTSIPTNSTAVTPSGDNEAGLVTKPVLLVSSKGGFAPLKVTALTNQDGIAATYDFGDGSTPLKTSSANHIYTEPGTYTINCLINGVMLEQKIQVIGQIPSAFSPNEDGINDEFKINDIEDISIEIRIFNRTGKLMFSGKGRSIAWDGKTPEGQNAEAGTYLYDIFATPDGGGSYKQKGTIHLFR
ncbi:MAG: gliding motility-associated C-terminal domain-containing protein [Bacteroidetes bacterium]|nr:gliding motility-associated C-terminal domain-containing protein [Bacteroidota bacterium]